MPRRKAWNGKAPAGPDEARRVLLAAASRCVERLGISRASLQDVAQEAGVTRQTVYRYFEDTDDLFNSAAVLSGGGFLERLRRRVARERTLADRIVETMVFAIVQIPGDPQLSALMSRGPEFGATYLLGLGFVQDEIVLQSDGAHGLSQKELDELAELLVRLLHSFVADPGKPRVEAELRDYLRRWLVPVIEARCAS